ncbi:PIN2/TERF1-interacting telomerase inhibitor 1 [Rana temporaria]|uniref:PIN2/TERF1-interacting telomerase inhibitor 1 n=1 Tax=Rana temporaria TaxID=8407 RepID=UPI001AACAF7D|nr:PIN2/TERF1-interacting telomerase inhibitor 1 [Rana temporaria]
MGNPSVLSYSPKPVSAGRHLIAPFTMAMLAEPRRKQKWSVDPRNSAWTKDESKFGQKMLEKMGWSKGKGLGAQEQGSTEHIKVQVKNNTMGLGACNNYEDKWIAHQDDFNQLLAELNDCHGTASSDSPANDSKKSFSLEEKSKTSKKRVHYMKFAKGKDLSCRSDTDLACIFGKREKRKKSGQDEADAESEKNDAESEEKEQESPSPKNEAELGNTVTSSLSVTQYFAQRMAELKKSQSRHTQAVQQSAEASPADSLDGSTEPKKKHKKKKPSRNDGDYENGSKLVERNEEEDPVHERKKPKSKKNRCEITTNGAEEQEEPQQAQEDELKRKKGKNKRNKEALDQIEKKEDTTFPIEDASAEEPKKKKKKKNKKQKSHD